MNEETPWERLGKAALALSPEARERYQVQFTPMVFHYPLEFGVVDSSETSKIMTHYSIN